MKLFSAIGKAILRSLNDKHANSQRKKAKKESYEETGIAIERAKRRKRRVNGSALYQATFQKKNAVIEQKHQRRNDFINDL